MFDPTQLAVFAIALTAGGAFVWWSTARDRQQRAAFVARTNAARAELDAAQAEWKPREPLRLLGDGQSPSNCLLIPGDPHIIAMIVVATGRRGSRVFVPGCDPAGFESIMFPDDVAAAIRDWLIADHAAHGGDELRYLPGVLP